MKSLWILGALVLAGNSYSFPVGMAAHPGTVTGLHTALPAGDAVSAGKGGSSVPPSRADWAAATAAWPALEQPYRAHMARAIRPAASSPDNKKK